MAHLNHILNNQKASYSDQLFILLFYKGFCSLSLSARCLNLNHWVECVPKTLTNLESLHGDEQSQDDR